MGYNGLEEVDMVRKVFGFHDGFFIREKGKGILGIQGTVTDGTGICAFPRRCWLVRTEHMAHIG